MSNLVSCRSCQKEFLILPKKYASRKYDSGILCLKCWSKPTSTNIKSISSSNNGSNSNSSSTSDSKNQFDWTFYGTTNNSKPKEGAYKAKFKTGDIVYVNTQKSGVVKGQVADVYEFGEGHTYYNVIISGTGKYIDYLSDIEIFTSEEQAKSSQPVNGN